MARHSQGTLCLNSQAAAFHQFPTASYNWAPVGLSTRLFDTQIIARSINIATKQTLMPLKYRNMIMGPHGGRRQSADGPVGRCHPVLGGSPAVEQMVRQESLAAAATADPPALCRLPQRSCLAVAASASQSAPPHCPDY